MDIKLYARIIEKSFPQIQVDTIAPVSGGWASDAFEVNGELIFRFPGWPEVEKAMQKEISLLPELAKVLSVEIPNFEFISKHNNKVFVGYKKIQGLPLASCDYSRGNLADQLAKILTEIHHFPVHRAMELKVPNTDWREEYVEFYNQVKDKAFPLMTEALQKRAVSVWESYLNNEDNFKFEPVFIHRDLSGDQHILCNPKTAKIAGIIDWEDSSIGDPAIDFTGIYWGCGEEFTKQLIAKYGGKVDETF